jgi:hypothetical protein
MNKDTLRKRAGGSRTISDIAWQHLEDMGYVDDALGKDFDEEQVAYIVGVIDDFKAMWGSATRGTENTPKEGASFAEAAFSSEAPFAASISEEERERALLVIDVQARVAATDTGVQGFRERHLKDGLLAPEDAEQFLQSGERALEALGTYLHTYYGWHRGEAKWWVLTGEKPSARPVRVSHRSAATLDAPGVYLITVEAPPWISPETFQGAFAEMRRRMHAERKPPVARSLRVVRFVERLRNNPDTCSKSSLTFKEMCQRWNEENPDEAFSKPRSFERAYQRTADIPTRQYNTEIEREETPELRRQRARMQKEEERFRERAQAIYAEAIETSHARVSSNPALGQAPPSGP